jgi:alkylresorcinol/alkylpyrone synthase
MGFHLRNQGLQIVLDRELAPFVRREVLGVVETFLATRGLARHEVGQWILHPGGRRIIEAMCDRLGLAATDMAATEAVLAEHGNMSSVTVLFVLDEVLRRYRPPAGTRAVMGAFGPGFGAEFAMLDFC